MKPKAVLVALLLVAIAAFAAYEVGVSVGQSRATEVSLVNKLSDAFLAETIVRSIDAYTGVSSQEVTRAQRALALQLADTMKFYSDRLIGEPSLRPATTVCAAFPRIEANLLPALKSEGSAQPQQDMKYVRDTLESAISVLRKRC